MKQWTIEEFKQYVRQRIDKQYYDTPSMIVLRSFYVGEVEKPKDVTVKLFYWLRSIAEKEIQIYKQLLSNK